MVFKFHNVISSFGFTENVMDQCIYHKVSGNKMIFLVSYVVDIFFLLQVIWAYFMK